MYDRLDLGLIEIDVFGGEMLYIFSHSDVEYLDCNKIKHMARTVGKNR